MKIDISIDRILDDDNKPQFTNDLRYTLYLLKDLEQISDIQVVFNNEDVSVMISFEGNYYFIYFDKNNNFDGFDFNNIYNSKFEILIDDLVKEIKETIVGYEEIKNKFIKSSRDKVISRQKFENNLFE